MKTLNIPICYNKEEFTKGVKSCESGKAVSLDAVSDDFAAGYAYQYEKEQIETQKGYGNYDN